MLHPTRPRWVVLNDTALEIARLFECGASLSDAAAALCSRYGIAHATATADAGAVERRLTDEGFLGAKGAPAPARSPALRTLFLHLTERCNLACPHCYVLPPETRARPPHELPTGAVVGLLDQLADLGGRAVTLSGGEPLLHPGLREIVAHAGARGLGVQLLTNGTLLDRDWAAFLAAHRVAVQVSLDGSLPEIHDAIRGRGSFRKALEAVSALCDAGLGSAVNLCATVMRHNVADLPRIIDLAERLGVPVRFLPLRRTGMAGAAWESVGAAFGVPELERFYRLVAGRQRDGRAAVAVSCGLSGFILRLPDEPGGDEIWCPVGRKLDIDAAGDAYPCVLLTHERFRVGNALRESLADLVASAGIGSARAALVGRRSSIARCASCLWRNLCQAGCMGQALDNTGTLDAPDDFCRHRQEAYREAFDLILAQEGPEER